MYLTASRVNAFDDWFSKLDDDDLELPAAKDQVSLNKNSRVTKRTEDLDDDSWVDSSDDEDDKHKKKTKNPRSELKANKSGDLERMFAAATKAKADKTSPSPVANPKDKKAENKTLKLLNKEDKMTAKKVSERRKAVREDSLQRRNSISQCMERQLSGGSSGGPFDDKLASPSLQSRPTRGLTPPRPKRSPIKSKSEAVKHVPLSALYGTPPCDSSPDATKANTSDEGSSKSVKANDQKIESEAVDNPKHQLPRRCSPSAGGPRDRSRDPLSRSRHGAYGRNADLDSSRRGVSRDSRRRDDPLSRSSHGSGQRVSRDSSLAQSRHRVARSSSIDPSRRRRIPQDPLSKSSHGALRLSRGTSIGPSRRHYREDDQGRGASLSRSTHGATRHQSLEDATNSRRRAGISLSSHGPPRHRSHEETPTPRRMPKGSSSRSPGPRHPNEHDKVKSPSRSRSSTRPPRRSHDQNVSRTRSYTELNCSSHHLETPIRTNDEELLRVAISMLQDERGALSSVEPRERSPRRVRSQKDSDLRRSSHGGSRRSKTPTRL